VTLGPAGVVVAARQAGVIRRPGHRVAVADTVGAGDAFMSALLAGLQRRELLGADRRAALRAVGAGTLEEIADEAVMAAAITCTRHGADPPTLADLVAELPVEQLDPGPGR
jgi:fructokinase